jgi:hypothetical protein
MSGLPHGGYYLRSDSLRGNPTGVYLSSLIRQKILEGQIFVSGSIPDEVVSTVSGIDPAVGSRHGVSQDLL